MLIVFGADHLSKDAWVVNSRGRHRCVLPREQPVLTSQCKRLEVPRFGDVQLSPGPLHITLWGGLRDLVGEDAAIPAAVSDEADTLAT